MRKRDIKIGMEVRHARGDVSMGTVTDVGNAVIYGTYPNGVKWIAYPAELQPWTPVNGETSAPDPIRPVRSEP